MSTKNAISLTGIEDKVSGKTREELLYIDKDAWYEVLDSQTAWFQQFGYSLPLGIWKEHEALADRLTK